MKIKKGLYGLYIDYPDHNVEIITDSNIKFPLGHAGFALVDLNGNSEYYDYGRYSDRGIGKDRKTKQQGNFVKRRIPNMRRGESSEDYAKRVGKHLKAATGEKVAVSIVPLPNYDKSKLRLQEYFNDRSDYNLLTNQTCAGVAADIIRAGRGFGGKVASFLGRTLTGAGWSPMGMFPSRQRPAWSDTYVIKKNGGRLIPKALFGTGLVKRGIRWLNNHVTPTREYAMFEALNNLRKELVQKKKRELQDLQQDLKDLGYYTKIVDNKWGPGTRNAIAKAEADGYKIDTKNFTISGEKLLKRKSNSSFMSSVKQFFGLEKKIPTQEEFIELKRKEVQERAAKINTETATPYFPLGNYMPKHDFDFYGTGSEGKGKAKGMTPDEVKILFTKYKAEALNYLDKHPDISNEAKKKVQRNINYYEKVIKDPQIVAKKGTGIGFGCIYSASGAFDLENLSSAKRGKVVFANNRQLAQSIKNSSDSPYEILPWEGTELKVGDIIQIGRSDSKIGPHHAVMVTGFNPLGIPKITQTNAGEAGMGDRDIDSAMKYIYTLFAGRFGDGDPNTPGIQPQGLQIVRFKGDSGDIKQWEREYNSMYKGDRK